MKIYCLKCGAEKQIGWKSVIFKSDTLCCDTCGQSFIQKKISYNIMRYIYLFCGLCCIMLLLNSFFLKGNQFRGLIIFLIALLLGAAGDGLLLLFYCIKFRKKGKFF